LHHVVLDRWSQASSPLHARDPRVKAVVVLGFLIAVATTNPFPFPTAAGYFGIVLVGILVARLPMAGLFLRASVVLPFSGAFAAISFLGGNPERGVEVLLKSYISALAVLLVIATTSLPRLLAGLERLGAPSIIVFIIQLVYRYLFVISEQAQHMMTAARCRGSRAQWRVNLRASVGSLAVLFGKSYQRAETVHRAMLARGFDRRVVVLRQMTLTFADILFFFAAGSAILVIRLPWAFPI